MELQYLNVLWKKSTQISLCCLILLYTLAQGSDGKKLEYFQNRSVLLIGMDGLRHDIFRLANLTNLEELLKGGIRANRLRPVDPPHSWPTQQSLVTGLYPESHGIISNSFYDPVYQRIFRYGSRPFFAPNFWKQKDVDPIWVTNERAGGRSAVFSWAGVEAYALPRYQAARHFEGWITPTLSGKVDEAVRYFKQNMDQIIDLLKSRAPPNFSALYWDHPDWCGHQYGPDSQELVYTMERTDTEAFGYLLQKLRQADLLDKINIIITADHGMKSPQGTPVIGLDTFLDRRRYFLSESMSFASIWPQDARISEILANLSQAEPYLKAYRKENAPKELHYGKSSRNAPVVVIPEKGFLVGYKNKALNTPGVHTFPSSDRDMHTIFGASGPAFKPGIFIEECRSIDLYPLMAKILGIRPRPNNGSDNLWKQVLREEFYNDVPENLLESAVAYIRPDTSRHHQPQIYGRVAFKTVKTITGSKTTQTKMRLYGLRLNTRYTLAVYTYGHPHHFGCSNIGEPLKFFDIPQKDGSIQTALTGTKDKIIERTFQQRDIRLNGRSSILGRMLVIKGTSNGRKIISCGSILPMLPR